MNNRIIYRFISAEVWDLNKRGALEHGWLRALVCPHDVYLIPISMQLVIDERRDKA